MATRRVVWVPGLLALAGLLVVGLGLRADAPGQGLDYVALGDSYSAGPLIPRQDLDAGLCLRSDHNYPSLLTRRLHVTSFRDTTCTGITTAGLSNPVDTGLPGSPAPAPLNALNSRTDLVTLGIGGNDGGLFSALFRRCPALAVDHRDGSPCRDAYTDAEGNDVLAARVRQVPAAVEAVLDHIHQRAPRAQVWVVGYLRVLPRHGTCSAIPLARGDYRWADRLERGLNSALATAAADRGDHFVDAYAASRGHDACAGRHAWVNGRVESLRRAAAYHPLRSGMQAVADLLAERIAVAQGAPTPSTTTSSGGDAD